MRKLKMSVLVLFFSFHVFSQKINNKGLVVEYKVFYNTEHPVVRNAKLVIKNDFNESIFLIEPFHNKKKNAEFKGEQKIEYTVGENILLFNYFNDAKQELLSKEQILFNTYIIKEEIPEMNWVLENEEKQIGNKFLKKATTIFRGRKYSAWYCPDYPLKFGPWKFNGLPGIIFEIFDETNRYHWELTSIKSNKDFLDFFNLIQKSKKGDTISIRKYSEIRYNLDLSSRIISKMPRDIKIISSKTERPSRNGIEILFEWEEKN